MAKVLLVAFSCCPGMGSEYGIGWNFAVGLSRRHDVTLLTTSECRTQIDDCLRQHPDLRLRVIYRDGILPRWLMFKSYPTANLYYYLWQLRLIPFLRGLQQRERFDLVHHVNWGRYWMASGAAFSGAPFVWGPVGAAEGAASALTRGMSLRGRFSEHVRDFMRWVFENDPLAARTARGASVIIAATHETADRIRAKWGVSGARVICSVGIDAADLPGGDPSPLDRFDHECISIGRLLNWKGFHLGLRAFAAAGLAKDARYALIGEGPEESRLRRLADELGIADRVDFLGQLPRSQALSILSRSRLLLHPSLHDSGGFVLVEAMALGRPVVCLDVGGPSVIVDENSGIRIRATDADRAVKQLTGAIRALCDDAALYARLSRGALARGRGEFLWSHKMDQIDGVYAEVLVEKTSLATQSPPLPSASSQPHTGSILRVESMEKSKNRVA